MKIALIIKNNPTAGQIFLLEDRICGDSTAKEGYKHPYIVISSNITGIMQNNWYGYIQLMRISTLKNMTDIMCDWELPIISYDNSIRYVIPYNIFSVKYANKDAYKGSIIDTEFGTSSDFIDLLGEIYCYVNHIGHVDVNKLREKKNRYMEIFNMYKERFNPREIVEDKDHENFQKAAYTTSVNNSSTKQRPYYMHSTSAKFITKRPAISNSLIREFDEEMDDAKYIADMEKDASDNVEYNGPEYETVYTSKTFNEDTEEKHSIIKDVDKSLDNIINLKGKKVKSMTIEELLSLEGYIKINNGAEAAKTLGMTRHGVELRLKNIEAEIASRV